MLRLIKQSEPKPEKMLRKKVIVIEDSFMSYNGVFEKRSRVLTAKNPFKRDDDVLDYDLDSEEEWNEQNGLDLNKP